MSTYSLVPLNLEEEKKKFFFDTLYNPQFVYEQAVPETYLFRFGPASNSLGERAKAICDKVIKKWETDSNFLEKVEGRPLERDEATKIIQNYLIECGLQDKVTLHFSSHTVVRTHIDGYKMTIRIPITYRENEIIGMLNHEIGTHVFRRINEEKQIWHQNREQFGLVNYLETEEGIAVLHGNLGSKLPNLWYSAIRYLACEYASTLSFSQVYMKLREYVSDRERCFNLTLRAKRGLTDTSEPGGFTKDQIYFRGFFRVSEWLTTHDYDMKSLYLGKIAFEDQSKAKLLAGEYEPILPPFMQKDSYQSDIARLIKNGSLL